MMMCTIKKFKQWPRHTRRKSQLRRRNAPKQTSLPGSSSNLTYHPNMELRQLDADMVHHQAASLKRRKLVRRPRLRDRLLETVQGRRQLLQRERAKTKKQQSEEIEWVAHTPQLCECDMDGKSSLSGVLRPIRTQHHNILSHMTLSLIHRSPS